MTRSHKVLGFLFVALLGIYGCARGPASAEAGTNASLQAKVQRLEDDFRAAAAARDSFRQKLVTAEERQANLQKQLDEVKATASAERDALKNEVKTRTAERDALQTQFTSFLKAIKEHVDRAETAIGNPAAPTQPAAPVLVGTNPTPPPTIPTPPAVNN